MDIREILNRRILILDGGMGTQIQEYKLSEKDYRDKSLNKHPVPLKGNHDILSITRPGIIKEIHLRYLEAGADIIETNTFSATATAQADYHLESRVYDMNLQAAKIAKEAARAMTLKTPKKPRFVAGSIGPTNKTASLSPDVNNPGFRAITFDELVNVYTEQVDALIKGGVDILLIETIFDTLNAKAALLAIQSVFDKKKQTLPVMASGTITDASGRILSGQTVEAFIIALEHAPLLSLGLNCALGARAMLPYLRIMHQKTQTFTSAHPNAGLPDQFGEYTETPSTMVEQIKEFLELGVINIIGGCCGTTPAHITAIASLAARYEPRTIPS